ncbi:hypothetical protein EDB85DRAFT_89581 [Lactarius pseudohatsudake]|nr:hypothetical protein EDB85DRAFT_89581 [Lactarius pseudohatsudake]
MPSFLRKFKHSQNLDIKDTPSLTIDSPSMIFSISQFFILIFRGLGRRASTISELVIACTDLPVSPSFPCMSEMFPSVTTDVIHPAHGPPSKCTPPAPAYSAHPHSCTPNRVYACTSCAITTTAQYSVHAAYGSPDSSALRSRSYLSGTTSRVPSCSSSPASRVRNASAVLRSSRPTQAVTRR